MSVIEGLVSRGSRQRTLFVTNTVRNERRSVNL
jgi:hypothetical protein